MSHWESNKFHVWAVISVPDQKGNTVQRELELLQYSHEYELNSIPSCILSIAVGRRADKADDPSFVSQIHRVVNVLKTQVPVVVWFKGRRLADDGFPQSTWPTNADGSAKPFVIFRGRAVSGGFRKSFGEVRYIMSLTHWMSDMNYSSAASQQLTPLTPNAFFQSAVVPPLVPAPGGAPPIGSGGYVGPGVSLSFFPTSTVTSDLWGGEDTGKTGTKGIKAWFQALSNGDRLNVNQINSALALVGETCKLDAIKNTDALSALSRFEPNANGQNGYRLGVPLSMDLHGANSGSTAHNIGKEIGLEGIDLYQNVTLWDKLAGQFHSNYLFSVVPTVESALVVPFIPGLRWPYHRNITANEYSNCSIMGDLPRPLRGVGVLMGRTWSTGGGAGKNGVLQPDPQFSGLGGWYGVCRPGLIMFKRAPRWLNAVAPSIYANNSAPVGIPISTASAPDAGNLTPGQPLRGIFNDAQPLWNAYAQALYAHELLKLRMGTLTGRIRFDIAPGSVIRIQAAEDKFTWTLLGQQDYMHCYASVLRVSTILDAESQTGSTSFALAHARTEAENVDPTTSVPCHPLWNTIWAGCSLVDDPAYANVTTNITAPALVALLKGVIPSADDLLPLLPPVAAALVIPLLAINGITSAIILKAILPFVTPKLSPYPTTPPGLI